MERAPCNLTRSREETLKCGRTYLVNKNDVHIIKVPLSHKEIPTSIRHPRLPFLDECVDPLLCVKHVIDVLCRGFTSSYRNVKFLAVVS